MIKFAKDYPLGSVVEIGLAYHMGGSFVADGHEGNWYVVGQLGDKDLKVARHPEDDYDLIVHVSRLVGCGWYSDRPTPSISMLARDCSICRSSHGPEVIHACE